eukprot:SAG22_NODE_116_length_19306_cov_247.696517_16_plen_270_part_00
MPTARRWAGSGCCSRSVRHGKSPADPSRCRASFRLSVSVGARCHGKGHCRSAVPPSSFAAARLYGLVLKAVPFLAVLRQVRRGGFVETIVQVRSEALSSLVLQLEFYESKTVPFLVIYLSIQSWADLPGGCRQQAAQVGVAAPRRGADVLLPRQRHELHQGAFIPHPQCALRRIPYFRACPHAVAGRLCPSVRCAPAVRLNIMPNLDTNHAAPTAWLPGCLAAWLPGCLAAWLPIYLCLHQVAPESAIKFSLALLAQLTSCISCDSRYR